MLHTYKYIVFKIYFYLNNTNYVAKLNQNEKNMRKKCIVIHRNKF